MVKRRFVNPIIASVFVSVFLFITNVVPFKRGSGFSSVLPQSKIDYLEGTVVSSPVINSKQTWYSLDLNSCECSGKSVYSTCSGKVKIYVPVEIVEAYFPGRLFTLSSLKGGAFIESGSELHIKGHFLNNVFYVTEVISCKFAKEIFIPLKKVRAQSRLYFRRLMYEWKNAGGLLLSLLAGSREYTTQNLSESFRKAGLSHVLALSGMHLSIFIGISVYIGKKFRIKKLILLFQLLSETMFVWFAGLSPSLLRAFICSLVLLFEEIASIKKSSMLEVLSFSFVVQVMLRPDDLFSLGFILSYGALVGILMFGNFFRRFYTRFSPTKYMAQSFASSTGAQALTIPVSLKYFGAVSPIGIITTVFVSPLISLFIYSGLAFIILCLAIPGLTSICGIFLNFQYNLIVILVDFFAGFPLISI